MNNNKDWPILRDKLVEILKDAEHYHSDYTDSTCFLSAYQLAVLTLKKHKALLKKYNFPTNIGGKGDGTHTSLSQCIANSLAGDIKVGKLSTVELSFFNTTGLEQFSFLDEKKILSQPSNTCFSMFRYIG